MILNFSEIKRNFARTDQEFYQKKIRALLLANKIKIIVLDDDPTGMQTVHGCLILTNWEKSNILKAFNHAEPVFYVLTNTRSHNAEKAETIITSVITNLIETSIDLPYKTLIISRSDSTLRGHFPLEPILIKKLLLDWNFKLHYPIFFIPALFEAGRCTYADCQYIVDNDHLIPVAETEFAKDSFFGYKSSNLYDFIRERTDNTIEKKDIASLSINAIRHSDNFDLSGKIEDNREKQFFVVNAIDYYDLCKFSYNMLGLLIKNNSSVIFRSSSSFVKAISGIESKPLLKKGDMVDHNGPGLFLVGSYTKKTSTQLNQLLLCRDTAGIELNVDSALKNPMSVINDIISQIKNVTDNGITPVVFTSRNIIHSDEKNTFLEIGTKISSVFIKLVKDLPFIPSYVVAKGGITAHNVLAKGFEIQISIVDGQILPGVPVIKMKTNQINNQIPLIIFPGNVGNSNSLKEVFGILH